MTRPFSAVSKKGFSIKNIKAKAKISLATASVITAASIIGISNSITGIASALSISSIYVNQGPAAGNTEVTIKGEGFLKTIEEKDEVIDVAMPSIYSGYGRDLSGIALTKSGKVYTWGDNAYGTAGTGESCAIETSMDYEYDCYYEQPQDITANFNGDRIIDVESLYLKQYIAVGKSGKVYVWGEDASIHNTTTDNASPLNLTDYIAPTTIKSLEGKQVKSVKSIIYSWLYTTKESLLVDLGVSLVFQTDKTEIGEYLHDSYSKYVEHDYSLLLGDMTLGHTNVNWDNGPFVIADNKLFILDGRQCNAPIVNDSTKPIETTECVKLVDLQMNFLAGAKQMEYKYILDNAGNMYMAEDDFNYDNYKFINLTEKYNLPKIKKFINNLVLTENGKIMRINEEGKFDETHYPLVNMIGISGDNGSYAYVPLGSYDTVCIPANGKSSMDSTCVKIPLQSTTKTVPAISKVSFGNVMTSNFRIVDNNTIIAYTPAHPAGKVDVKLYPVDSDKDTVILPQSYEYLDDNSTGNLNPGEQVVPSAPNTGVRKY